MTSVETKFPGITKYGCSDPYYDYDVLSQKCNTCPRRKTCYHDKAYRISQSLDDDGLEQMSRSFFEKSINDDPYTRKKKVSSKPKRKTVKKCSCKKK